MNHQPELTEVTLMYPTPQPDGDEDPGVSWEPWQPRLLFRYPAKVCRSDAKKRRIRTLSRLTRYAPFAAVGLGVLAVVFHTTGYVWASWGFGGLAALWVLALVWGGVERRGM